MEKSIKKIGLQKKYRIFQKKKDYDVKQYTSIYKGLNYVYKFHIEFNSQ